MEENRNGRTWRISVFLTVVIVGCLAVLIFRIYRNSRSEHAYEDMRESSVAIVTETTEMIVDAQLEESATEDEAAQVWEDMPQIDFEKLWETNTDICAWIVIPGTQVNYPVLRRENTDNPYDDYYLQHTVEKTGGLPGAIYMEPCNSGDFSDNNTVLYGHNMKNGSMFGSLHEYEDAAVIKENPYVYVVTPERQMVYQIAAVVNYSDTHILGTYDCSSTEGYEKYLESLEKNRDMGDIFAEDIPLTTEQKMLTMSTCIKGQDTRRLLVGAVLIDEYERKAD